MKNLTLLSPETEFKSRFYCCLENLKGNYKFLLMFLLFMGSFSGKILAQGTLVPACNLVGPLVACAVQDPSDTSNDIIINLEVARSGAPNLIDAQHNANFVYSFPTNSSGAFIRSYGNVVYNPITNRTTQSLTVCPGTGIPEFNLQVNVTNTTSSPATVCECSKSVSVSRVAATSSFTPIACFGQTTTLTVVGSLSDIGEYTYTLLPSGPTNTTGIFPGLVGSVDGITYVVNVESAEGCSTTTSQTITQPAFSPVVLNCPETTTTALCLTQAQVNAAFTAWLNSFSYTGGTSPSLVMSPSQPTAPSACGGSVTVTWTVSEACGETQTCTRTFTVPTAAGVIVNGPTNSTTNACTYANQAAANTAFNAWLAGFTVSGGCSPVGSYGTPVAPPYCGGTTTVTYNVTDSCYAGTTITRTFTITGAAAVVANGPANSTTNACTYANQAAANAAFNTWLTGFTVSGGCSPVGSYGTPVAPPYCGGTTTVTYNVTDSCYAGTTITRTFTITGAAAVVANAPANSTTSACTYADQAAANAAFNTWLAGFTVSGGCAPVGSYGQPVAPAYCGGTTTVTYNVTDSCYAGTTITRTFTITAAPPVVANGPANSTTNACLYANQAAANAAFATWLGQFTVSGGCLVSGGFGEVTPQAPAFCGGTTTVTFNVNDRCYAGTTITRTFTITGAAAVVVNGPQNSTTNACTYADQAAANAAFNTWLAGFTVSGGCSPVGSYGTPVAPPYCGGTTTVTYNVTDSCYAGTTITRTFTITGGAAVVVNGPQNSTANACTYADQAAANAAFNTWLAGFTVSGGCAPVGSYGSPVAPPYCGGTTTVTYNVTDSCYAGTTITRTFTITGAAAVVANGPANSTTNACTYANQDAANAAFNTWLAGFTVSGGCSPVASYGQPVAPPYCGGTVTVTYNVTDSCYAGTTIVRTFTINPAPAVVVNGPTNSTTSAGAYADQTAANAAFALWLQGFTVSGGCAPVGSYGQPVAPPYCGGTVSVTYTVTDRCYQGTTITRTFTITPVAPATVNGPANSTTNACIYANQAAVNAAFATWLGQFTVNGGISPVGGFGEVTPQAPLACGGTTTVTYTVTDNCHEPVVIVRTFTITPAPAVTVNGPENSTTNACTYANQAAANTAFNAWLAQFTSGGGCSPVGVLAVVGSAQTTLTAPAYCGGTITVSYTVTDKCYAGTTITRTFTITPAPAVVANGPANSTVNACTYADQAAANAAFNTWLAGFTVSGGCSPVGSYGSPVAPPYCGGTTTVTYNVTDSCYAGTTITRTFTITGSSTVVVGQPANSSTSACLYADQAAANAAFNTWLAQFTVSGGCAPVGSYGTPVAPSYCGGTTTVTYNVTDSCYAGTSVTRTFTITAPPAITVGQPENSSTLACVYTDQAAANAAFTAWLAQFTVSGGCAPVGSYGTPVAPSYCGGTVSVTYTVTDRCYAGTSVTRTFSIAEPTPVVLTCGSDVTLAACSTPAQITAAWNAFLTSTTASGGCNGVLTRTECPMPTACGGYADVTWTYTVASCGAEPNTTTCTRRFTVASTSPIVFNCGTDVTIQGCGSQTAVDSAWNAFLASTTASGGCNGVFTRTAANSPSACGGSVDVTWTYTATACGGEASTQTCTRTFTVTPSGPVTITAGNNVTLPACSTQAQLDAAWTAFLGSTTATGGCEGALTVSEVTPPSLCGGFVDVTWTYTVAACGQSTCPNGTNTQTVTRRFTVAAPEVTAPVLTCPTNIEIPGNLTQAAIDQAYAAWLATANGVGGCNGVLTNNSTGAPACGTTATVVFTYTTTCEPFTTTCTATFTVLPCDNGNGNNGTIGDFVWNDMNQNGIQDAGEPGIAGVQVALNGGSVSMNTNTDSNGWYLFSNLPANTYTVTFTTPSGHIATLHNQGSDDGIDSDSDGGQVTGIVLTTGQNNITIDAGFYLEPAQGLEGCTLGYWKNHTDRWCSSYRTCDRFGDIFPSAPAKLANLTLLQALNMGGGGIYNLARQGVAALLNACGDDVNYAGYEDDAQAVIAAIDQAFETGGTSPGILASQLDTFNNAGCPLGGTSATTATNCVDTETETMQALKVVLHPNPYTDSFNLEITTPSADKVGVAVYDMMGKLLEKQEVNIEDVPALKVGKRYPSGVYNVIVTQGSEVKTLRVIKR